MKRTVTILGGDERMAWLAENLRREGYIIRLAALLPPAPLKNRLPQPESPDRLLPESETVILAVPTVGPDGMLRTPTVPECYPLAECLRRLPEGAMVLGGTLPPDCRKIAEERHLAYTNLLALQELHSRLKVFRRPSQRAAFLQQLTDLTEIGRASCRERV